MDELDVHSLIYLYRRKNYNYAFELSKKSAKGDNPNGLNRLDYCYEAGTISVSKRYLDYIKRQ